MKKYDNFFIPVDDIEKARKYYETNLGLKVKFDFSDIGMIAFSVDGEEAAIILKDKNNSPFGLLFNSFEVWFRFGLSSSLFL